MGRFLSEFLDFQVLGKSREMLNPRVNPDLMGWSTQKKIEKNHFFSKIIITFCLQPSIFHLSLLTKTRTDGNKTFVRYIIEPLASISQDRIPQKDHNVRALFRLYSYLSLGSNSSQQVKLWGYTTAWRSWDHPSPASWNFLPPALREQLLKEAIKRKIGKELQDINRKRWLLSADLLTLNNSLLFSYFHRAALSKIAKFATKK